MDQVNPYAPPASEVAATPGKGVWRQQNLLIMQRNAELPHRCVKCNEDSEPGKLYRFFYLNIWLQIAMVILFLVFNLLAILPLIIVSLIFRKTAKFSVPMCARHRRQRLWMTLVTVGMLLFSIIVAMVSIRLHDLQGGLFAISVTLFVIALVLALIRGQVLRPKKIDREMMIFKGAKPPFLDSLPEFIGTP